MRKATIRKVRLEITENAVPLDDALTALARVIAAGMLKETQKREAETCETH